jgi:SAM-dependent methyltransferase
MAGNYKMHLSSYDKMTSFKEKYLSSKVNENLKIYDIGSGDINGTYKPIFSEPSWKYFGIDTAKGKNVDIVLNDPYFWRQIESNSADVVVSGQAFEHIEHPWLTMLEINRVLKPGGLCCIIAPAGGPDHKYPVDCWRFHPDGFRALTKWTKLNVMEVFAQWDSENYQDGSDIWQDCILICKKDNCNNILRIKELLVHKMFRWSVKLATFEM